MNAADSSRTARATGLREAAVAGALYVALTLILTYPFSLNVHHGVLAGGADERLYEIVGSP